MIHKENKDGVLTVNWKPSGLPGTSKTQTQVSVFHLPKRTALAVTSRCPDAAEKSKN